MNRVQGYALASKLLIEERKPILYMYRERPDNKYDSGWRFFSGYESDEYVNNPINIGIYDISTITDFYPYIVKYLELPFGTVLERYDKERNFSIFSI